MFSYEYNKNNNNNNHKNYKIIFFIFISCALLESLGDNSSYEFRNSKFDEADIDNDGWITYEEFLPVNESHNCFKINKKGKKLFVDKIKSR